VRASDAIRGGLERHFGSSWRSRTATVSLPSTLPPSAATGTGPSSRLATSSSSSHPRYATADPTVLGTMPRAHDARRRFQRTQGDKNCRQDLFHDVAG
jgi:hypothetical protein